MDMGEKMSINKTSLNYYWRLIATTIAYSTFGIGGIFIYVCYPILKILPLSITRKQYYGRKIIHYAFRFFTALMHRLGIFTYHIEGKELLQEPGQLIVANHPSLIDVVFLLSVIPETNCIVRYGLVNNIFTRGPLKTANYIVNKNPEQLIQECAETLENKFSLLIFPEGTRTKPHQEMRLKKGTANIALRSQKSLRPVIITCRPAMLQRGVKWYHIPQLRPHFIISVKDSIAIQPYLELNSPIGVKSRLLTKDLQQFFDYEVGKQHQQY